MAVTVSTTNAAWSQFRILTATTFGATGSGAWTTETMASTAAAGFHFVSCNRQCLPGIGEAVFAMEFGVINGVTVAALDRLGKYVRIQASRDGSTWRTIWLGRVAFQDDAASPGATTARGTRIYRCNDLLYSHLDQYPLDRHADYAVTGALSFGHPGYNTRGNRHGTNGGNRESTGSSYAGPDSTSILNFGIDDAGATKTATTWTDAQALENAMLLKRESGDPIFDLDVTPSSLLGETTAWEVSENDTAWALANRICDRKRGRGLAYLDWDDDSGTPTGAIDVKLRVRPQIAADITYTTPTGGSVTINGATSSSSTITVDLQGDHRVVDGGFTVRSYGDATVDELTTEGERIVVAATLSGYDGTIAERWLAAQETAWLADRTNPLYEPVLRKFGLVRTASYSYEDGDNGAQKAAHRGDYWTDALGTTSNTHTCVTSPQMVRIMDTVPFYDGYTYASGSGVPSGSASADGLPRLGPPRVWIRTTTNRYIDLTDYTNNGHRINVDDDGISVSFNADANGDRMIRGSWAGTATRTITEDSLTFTVGLEMPQRARLYSSIAGTVRRRRTIRVKDANLWIAHRGCIWDLDRSSSNADGRTAVRPFDSLITGSTYGKVLRDDRAALARIHYLAWEWYRSDSGRSSVTYTIRDCGLLPSWTDATPATVNYAKLGQVITSLAANGQTYTPGTPVTRIEYDNTDGTTTWHTDWQEFDHAA